MGTFLQNFQVTVQDLGSSKEQIRELAISKVRDQLRSEVPATFQAAIVRGQPGNWGEVVVNVWRCRRRLPKLHRAVMALPCVK